MGTAIGHAGRRGRGSGSDMGSGRGSASLVTEVEG